MEDENINNSNNSNSDYEQTLINKMNEIDSFKQENEFWEKNWRIKVDGIRPIVLKQSISYNEHDTYYLKTESIIQNSPSLQKMKESHEAILFHSYNPFVYKLNMLESENRHISEQEINLFGFNKMAICSERKWIEKDNKQMDLFWSVYDQRSNIIMFRDGGHLSHCIIYEKLSLSQMRISYILHCVVDPWLHSSNIQLALERQMMMITRFFKTLVDLPNDIENIPSSVAIERNGYELVLPELSLPGKIIYNENNLRISLTSTNKTQSSYIVHGFYEVKSDKKYNKDTMMSIAFGNRCHQVETKEDGSIIIHKEEHDDVASDHYKTSLFMYGDICALLYYHSIHSPMCRFAHSTNDENKRIFFFDNAYMFFSREENNMIKVQFNFSITVKENKPSTVETTLKTFLDYINSLRSFAFEETKIEKQMKLNDEPIKIQLETYEFDDNSFFPKLQTNILKKICSYLDDKSILSLKYTNKHIKQFMEVVINQMNKQEIHSSEETRYTPNQFVDIKPIEIQEPKELMNLNNQNIGMEENESKWNGLKNDPIKLIEHSNKLDELKPTIYEGHTNIIRSMDIHTYTGDIVTGSSDRKIRVWKKDNPSDVQVYIGPNSSLMETKFVDEYICVAYKCGTVKYINPKDSKQNLVFDVPNKKMEGFYPIKNTKFLVWNETVEIVTYCDFKKTIEFTYDGHLRKITTSRPLNEWCFVSGSADRTVHLWDIRLPAPLLSKFRPHKSGVTLLEILNDYQFSTVGNEKIISTWDSRKLDKPLFTFENNTCAMAIRDNYIVCGVDGGNIQMIDYNGCLKGTLHCGNDVEISSVAINNHTVAAGSKSGKLYVFNDVYY